MSIKSSGEVPVAMFVPIAFPVADLTGIRARFDVPVDWIINEFVFRSIASHFLRNPIYGDRKIGLSLKTILITLLGLREKLA
jgi:hypothetical protein